LNLLPGSALLIKEQLKSVNLLSPEVSEDIQVMLEDHDIQHLSIEQVIRIINSRVDWPKV